MKKHDINEVRAQHIKVRMEGSPVKWDGVITEATPDGKRIKVLLNGPMGEIEMVPAGNHRLASHCIGRDGKPVDDWRAAVSSRLWEVL